MTKTVQPLQDVDCVLPSGRRGSDISPHVMWCDTEFAMHLKCGHIKLVVRMADHESLTQPRRPLPNRVRCQECPAQPAKSRPRKPRPAPTTDPVVSYLSAQLAEVYEGVSTDRQLWATEWAANYSGHITDTTLRHRGYAAIALVAADEYLPHCHENERAHEVRAALHDWHDHPTETTRAAVATARQRLYNVQLRDGDWLAIRGVHAAAKLASPHPHRVEGAREAATFGPQRQLKIAEMRDARTRAETSLAGAAMNALTTETDDGDTEHTQQARRDGLDHLRAAEQADTRLNELISSMDEIDPFLTEAMLVTYQHTVFG